MIKRVPFSDLRVEVELTFEKTVEQRNYRESMWWLGLGFVCKFGKIRGQKQENEKAFGC